MYGRRIRLGSQGRNLRLTIPREVIKHFGLEVGDEFDMLWEDQKLIVDLSSGERSKLFDPPAQVEPAAEPESVEA
jgi:antitoxin component of MazEF toxin-antitoxin module